MVKNRAIRFLYCLTMVVSLLFFCSVNNSGEVFNTEAVHNMSRGGVDNYSYSTKSSSLIQDEEGCYLIKTEEDLRSIENDMSANYKLISDIEIKSESWTAMGLYSDPNWPSVGVQAFAGMLDGNGHSISGLKILYRTNGRNEDSTGYKTSKNFGLFARLEGATIKNLMFNRPIININDEGYKAGQPIDLLERSIEFFNVGIVAGTASSGIVNLENVFVKDAYYSVNLQIKDHGGRIESEANLGGLIGHTETNVNIINCKFECKDNMYLYAIVGTEQETELDSWIAISVGGIIGNCYQSRSYERKKFYININNCVVDTRIIIDAGRSLYDVSGYYKPYISVGGFVGNSEERDINNPLYQYRYLPVLTINNSISVIRWNSYCEYKINASNNQSFIVFQPFVACFRNDAILNNCKFYTDKEIDFTMWGVGGSYENGEEVDIKYLEQDLLDLLNTVVENEVGN